jgi:NAD(P)-dependent dehydrogenase (short-subunit alcohol dehydrogenase family)
MQPVAGSCPCSERMLFWCRAAIPHLHATRGRIVNLSSDAGVQGDTGAAAHCPPKDGVSIRTKALTLELAPARERVNAVRPGDIAALILKFQARTGFHAC